MRPTRTRLLYLLFLPAIAVAAGILGYYTWKTASQFARLGEETIAQSTLLIVSEKVEDVEQRIISADNAVLALIDPRAPERLEAQWRPVAREVSPSVKAVLVLDETGNVLAESVRGTEQDRRDFLKVFDERILADLELERQPTGRLKHHHGTYAGSNYLFSYRAMRVGGRRYYAIVHHDTGWIVREIFPALFASEAGKRHYNVVDENNRRVYGPSLARAGDYLVGRRFPTTLYNWRLQVAPKQAPLLDAQSRSRRFNEASLVAVAFFILLLGVAFVIYAGEKERRLSALKAEFVANVSHEIKTPLSVVRMFGEMLLTGRVRSAEKEQEYLEIICRESERLSTLVENVLDFAALERGKREFALTDGDLRDVIGRAVDTFRFRAEREGMDVTTHVEEGLPPLRMDEQAILLAVVNLLDNALKYGERTPIEIRAEVDGKYASVRVRDRGPGIAPEDRKRVFERFYRTRRSGHARGSGIGLALVKHIAEAHGGRAFAVPAEGGGACVGFTIPLPASARGDRRSVAPTPARS